MKSNWRDPLRFCFLIFFHVFYFAIHSPSIVKEEEQWQVLYWVAHLVDTQGDQIRIVELLSKWYLPILLLDWRAFLFARHKLKKTEYWIFGIKFLRISSYAGIYCKYSFKIRNSNSSLLKTSSSTKCLN